MYVPFLEDLGLYWTILKNYIFQLKLCLGGGSKVPDYGSLELHNMAADDSIRMNSLPASINSSTICCQMLPRTSKLARVKHWLQSKVKI